jgi:hypothetical protein
VAYRGSDFERFADFGYFEYSGYLTYMRYMRGVHILLMPSGPRTYLISLVKCSL